MIDRLEDLKSRLSGESDGGLFVDDIDWLISEAERLNTINNELDDTNGTLDEENDRLNEENKKLKAENKQLTEFYQKIERAYREADALDTLDKELKQALQEVNYESSKTL